MKRLAGLLTAPFLVLGLGACDGPTEPFDILSEGTFEATVSGSVEMELEGEAFSAAGRTNDQLRVWVVDMDDGDIQLTLIVRKIRIPEPGTTFQVVPREESAPPLESAHAFLSISGPDGGTFYTSHGGTVTVTERADDRGSARGEFTVTVEDDAGEGTVLTISGRFHSIEDFTELD